MSPRYPLVFESGRLEWVLLHSAYLYDPLLRLSARPSVIRGSVPHELQVLLGFLSDRSALKNYIRGWINYISWFDSLLDCHI